MKVFIYAVPTRAPSEEDEDVEGTYSAVVDDEVADDLVASAALDAFHSDIAVGELEDFEFIVADEDGKELSEPDPDEQADYESYALSDMADIEKVSDEVPAAYRHRQG